MMAGNVLNSRLWLFLLVSTVAVALGEIQKTFGQPGPIPGQEVIPVRLSDLPDPPDEILELLQRGKVKFVTGARPWTKEESQQAYRAFDSRHLKLLGETKHEVVYQYASRLRWRIQPNGSDDSKRIVRVSVRYVDLELSHRHIVWLRRQPSPEKFWNDKIVLHELDHVRLSSDPIFKKRFVEQLNETRVLSKNVDRNVTINEAWARKVVSKHVKEIFSDIEQLVSIRYRELDRMTQHGMLAIPKGSKLESWLKPTQAPAKNLE